jgi:WD40 repeat protein
LTVKGWDLVSGQEKLAFKGHPDTTSAAFSGDGRLVVCGNRDGTVDVLDVTTGKKKLTITGHKQPVCAVAVSAGGTRILSASTDGTMKVRDAATGQAILSLRGAFTFGGLGNLGGLGNSMSISPDGQRIVWYGRDGTMRMTDVATGQEKLTFKGAGPPVAFSADGRRIISGASRRPDSLGGSVKVWEAPLPRAESGRTK